jgi:hypothetical protein
VKAKSKQEIPEKLITTAFGGCVYMHFRSNFEAGECFLLKSGLNNPRIGLISPSTRVPASGSIKNRHPESLKCFHIIEFPWTRSFIRRCDRDTLMSFEPGQ